MALKGWIFINTSVALYALGKPVIPCFTGLQKCMKNY